jgi:hypothetical protein
MMKKILLLPILAGCLCIPAYADDPYVRGAERLLNEVEEEVPTKADTISSGTITEYAPDSTCTVRESAGPVKYHFGKIVTYVTRGGRTLSDDEVLTRMKVGTPVRVTYARDGDERVISRVELDED